MFCCESAGRWNKLTICTFLSYTDAMCMYVCVYVCELCVCASGEVGTVCHQQ